MMTLVTHTAVPAVTVVVARTRIALSIAHHFFNEVGKKRTLPTLHDYMTGVSYFLENPLRYLSAILLFMDIVSF